MAELKITTVLETKEFEQGAQKSEQAIEDNAAAVDGLTNQLDKMTGGAISGFKKAVGGAKTFIGSLKAVKVAIAATGIGLLVIAVGTLVSYFTNTQRGADKINVIFKAIGATIDVLVDRLSSFGEGLVAMLSGDFDKGLDLLAGSFKGVGDEILREAKAASQLEKDFQALEKRKIAFIVTEKQMEAQIKAARLASEDFSKSVEERNAANERAISLEKKLGDQRAVIAAEDLRIKREQNALGESTNDDLRDEAELEARLFEIEGMRDERLKELIAKRRTLNDELSKSNANKREEIELELMQSLNSQDLETDPIQSTIDVNAKLEEENKRHLDAMASDQHSYESLLNSFKDDALAKDEARANAKIAIQDSVNNALIAGESLAVEGSKTAKGIAVAQALFSAYLAINKTLSEPLLPFPANVITAASIGVTAFANVKKILSTNPKASSGGGGGSSSVSIASPQQQQRRVPDFGFSNRGVGGQQNADFGPTQSYVIEQKITDKQALAERIDDQARVA